MKKLSYILLVLFMVTVFVGCSQSYSYTVLVSSDNEPYSSVDENGEPKGFEVDILKATADAEGFDVKVTADINSDYNCCSSKLTDGSENFDYTTEYCDTAIVFAVKKNSKISAYEQILSKTIGVIDGSDGENFANQIAPQYDITVNKYTDRTKMYKDVLSGKIIGCFDEELTLQQAIKDGTKLQTFENSEHSGSLSFAVNKGKNANFIKSFNKGLQTIIDNGEYKKIAEKYGVKTEN